MALDRFNNAEPIDVTKLNEMIDAITTLTTTTTGLVSQTKSTGFTPVVYAGKGSVTLPAKVGDVSSAIKIDYSSADFRGTIPSVTITPRLSVKGSVPFYLKTGMATGSAEAFFITTAGMGGKKIWFDWIAVAMIANS